MFVTFAFYCDSCYNLAFHFWQLFSFPFSQEVSLQVSMSFSVPLFWGSYDFACYMWGVEEGWRRKGNVWKPEDVKQFQNSCFIISFFWISGYSIHNVFLVSSKTKHFQTLKLFLIFCLWKNSSLCEVMDTFRNVLWTLSSLVIGSPPYFNF